MQIMAVGREQERGKEANDCFSCFVHVYVATDCFLFTVSQLNEPKDSVSGSSNKSEENISGVK